MSVRKDTPKRVAVGNAVRMNRAELRRALNQAEIRSDVYSLDDGYVENTLCLGANNSTWEVYFCERGERSGLRSFATEAEACEHMLNVLMQRSDRADCLRAAD
jgi:TRAP-type uncharacterized transport system substrate-binding protein